LAFPNEEQPIPHRGLASPNQAKPANLWALEWLARRVRLAGRTRRADRGVFFLVQVLKENLGPDDTVVFVDDFAGTGNQVCTGWREVMEELLPGEPNIYLMQ